MTAIVLTVKLNSLARLFGEIMHHNWLCCHFHDINLLSQRLFILWFLQFTILQDQTISSTLWVAARSCLLIALSLRIRARSLTGIGVRSILCDMQEGT